MLAYQKMVSKLCPILLSITHHSVKSEFHSQNRNAIVENIKDGLYNFSFIANDSTLPLRRMLSIDGAAVYVS